MPKKDPSYWIGFDLGGTKMLSVVMDDDLKPLGRDRRKTRGHEGQEAGLERIRKTIEKSLEVAGLKPGQLAGIGVGSPGPLDLNRGMILDTPNLGWKNAPLQDMLEKHFSCPAVVCNDVDAGVYGEYAAGAARKARCVLGVFPGTGIGGGCVYEGEILRGKKNSVMEIGHVQVVPDGPLCGCGNRGCLEAIASRLAISQAAAAAAYRGEAPYLMEKAGTDLAQIRSGVLTSSIKAGDRSVETIVRQAAAAIGRVIGNTVNLLGPDIVLLGGGLVEAMPDLYVEEVSRAARRTAMPDFNGTFKVVAASLGDDATATGAAAWARRRLSPGE